MCDTFVALGPATVDGSVVFGKNSDRPFVEPQPIVYYPRKLYPIGAEVKCTYISIPQVEETYAILLSKPSWMWGSEMGANECNVVIGNEAVWSKEPYGPSALLGMDLLRLALERGSTALQAVQIICELLQEHGQGGSCWENENMTYHNSFLVADPTDAWVLETAGKWWIAQQITAGVRNISNRLSIRTEYTMAKDGLIDHVVDQGYCEDSTTFDFARCFSTSPNYESTRLLRESRGHELLQTHFGQIDSAIMMKILRDHSADICMHGSIRTTASQVSFIRNEQAIHWLTGSPHPCRSLFKPFVVLPQESPQIIDIWEKMDELDPVSNKQVIQNLHERELEMTQTIKKMLKQKRWSPTDIQALTSEAINFERSLLSL